MKTKPLIYMFFVLVVVLAGCEDDFNYESNPPAQNPEYSLYEFMKLDTTMETMVAAIDRAGLVSVFDGSAEQAVTLLALNDAAWRAEFRRTASGGYPNPYKGQTIDDIPVEKLRDFILGLTIPGDLYTTSYPYPFDITSSTLNPNVSLRLQVENFRYQLRANAGLNPAAAAAGRTHFRSNIQMTNGVLFIYENFFSLIS